MQLSLYNCEPKSRNNESKKNMKTAFPRSFIGVFNAAFLLLVFLEFQ